MLVSTRLRFRFREDVTHRFCLAVGVLLAGSWLGLTPHALPSVALPRQAPTICWEVRVHGHESLPTHLNYRFVATETHAAIRYHSQVDTLSDDESAPNREVPVVVQREGELTGPRFDDLLRSMLNHVLRLPDPGAHLGATVRDGLVNDVAPRDPVYSYAYHIMTPLEDRSAQFRFYPSQEHWDFVHYVLCQTLIGADEQAAETQGNLGDAPSQRPLSLDPAFMLNSYQSYLQR